MEDSGLAGLGFVIICMFAVLCFLSIVLLPIGLLIHSHISRRKAGQPEKDPVYTKQMWLDDRIKMIEKGFVPSDDVWYGAKPINL